MFTAMYLQAVEVCLGGVQAAGGDDWSQEACYAFTELTEDK